jgi:hypothetical protein
MQFIPHRNLEGRHAIFSASSWYWLNDEPEELVNRLCSQYATTIGTILHNVARNHIKYRIKLHKYDKNNVVLELLTGGVPAIVVDTIDFDSMFDNLMTYINDCIGFRMEPEVVLAYSDNFFGTADAIAFSEKERFLRIHDYKSGVTKASMNQLKIYAALFCLEYGFKPGNITTELRLYQSNEVIINNPETDELVPIIDKIVTTDKFLTRINEEV